MDFNGLVKPSLYFCEGLAAAVVLGVTATELLREGDSNQSCCLLNDKLWVCWYTISASALALGGTAIIFALRFTAAFTSFRFPKASEIILCCVLSIWWIATAVVMSANQRHPDGVTERGCDYPSLLTQYMFALQGRQASVAIAWASALAFFISGLVSWFAPEEDASLAGEYKLFNEEIELAYGENRDSLDPDGLENDRSPRPAPLSSFTHHGSGIGSTDYEGTTNDAASVAWTPLGEGSSSDRWDDVPESRRNFPDPDDSNFATQSRRPSNQKNLELVWSSTPLPVVTRSGRLAHRQTTSQMNFQDLLIPNNSPRSRISATYQRNRPQQERASPGEPRLEKTASWR